MAQWLGVRLPVQGTRLKIMVWDNYLQFIRVPPISPFSPLLLHIHRLLDSQNGGPTFHSWLLHKPNEPENTMMI